MLKKPGIGTVKNQDILESQAKIVYLSIGSNLGNRKTNIERAKFLLSVSNIKIVKTSNYYETESFPHKKFPKYLNVSIETKTFLKPDIMFKILKSIETKLGRKKTKKNYPRTCDIDILDYDSKTLSINLDKQILTVPHPRMHKRNFVLLPLFEISKKWYHPSKKQKISQLLSNFKNIELRSIKIV